MITLNFYSALAAYLLLVISIVLFAWAYAKKQKDKDLSLKERYIWFCSVCTYTYINTREEAISLCPRCGSYNKR